MCVHDENRLGVIGNHHRYRHMSSNYETIDGLFGSDHSAIIFDDQIWFCWSMSMLSRHSLGSRGFEFSGKTTEFYALSNSTRHT